VIFNQVQLVNDELKAASWFLLADWSNN